MITWMLLSGCELIIKSHRREKYHFVYLLVIIVMSPYICSCRVCAVSIHQNPANKNSEAKERQNESICPYFDRIAVFA